jgi:hypothetical protein
VPNIDNVFPSHYLKASDLNGASPAVTIDRLEVEPIGRNKEMKPVLYFIGKEKGLVLNKTNASKIAQLSGSKDTDDWHGFKIRLYATEAEFGGETFEAIRVKAAGVENKPKPAPEPEFGGDDSDPVPF